jgi:hypothetical protein
VDQEEERILGNEAEMKEIIYSDSYKEKISMTKTFRKVLIRLDLEIKLKK